MNLAPAVADTTEATVRVRPRARFTVRATARGAAFAMLLIFAASVPLENIGRLGALGSAARIAGILAALAGAIALCVDLPVRRAGPVLFFFGAFVIWVALSNFWSEDVVKTTARTATFVQLLLLAWLIWQEVRTSRACAALMQAFVAGTAFACIDAIVTQHPVHGGVPRFAVGDPNDFGVVVVIGMAMAYHLVVTSKSRFTRVGCIAFLPLGAVAVFLTASRTGAVVLILATLMAVLDRRNLRPRRLLTIGVVCGVMVVAVLNLATPAQIDRIGSVGTEMTNGTLDQRTSQWVLSYSAFSHHPLLGVGADAFRDVSKAVNGRSAPSHNSFLGVLSELGAPGLLLFGLVFVEVGRRLARLPRGLRRSWITIALVWLIGASTLSWEHRKITWFLVALLLVQCEASRRDRTGTSDGNDGVSVSGPDYDPRLRTQF